MKPVKVDDHVTLSTKLDGLASMTVSLLVEPRAQKDRRGSGLRFAV
jgi:hypothetical protein